MTGEADEEDGGEGVTVTYSYSIRRGCVYPIMESEMRLLEGCLWACLLIVPIPFVIWPALRTLKSIRSECKFDEAARDQS